MREKASSWKKALLTGFGLAAVPIVGLNAILAFNIVASAQRDADGVAAEVMALAETRIDDAATTLISLGLKNVSGCSPRERDDLLKAAQRQDFAEELAVMDASGGGACAAVGAPRVVRLTSPQHGTRHPNVTFAAAAFGETGVHQLVELSWGAKNGARLRLILPGDRLFPYFLKSRTSAAFRAQLSVIGGGVIAQETLGLKDTDAAAAALSVRSVVNSERYPLRIDVETPASALASANSTLFLYTNLGGLGLALMVAFGSILIDRRSGGPVREIADAIRNGEFIPYYQPVIDMTTGRLAGCEVLVRWRKPDGTVLPPGRFITLAEASGEIFPMTLALMEIARNEVGASYANRPDLKLGFNLFAGHFEDERIVDDVRRIFAGSQIRMSQLMFEVTERQPLPDIRKARLVIANLQAMGARVALDDVGTGHGGLSYLLKLGVDVMKMDKMFVDAIGTERYSIAIVDSMVKLAEDMKLELIAEGVETFEQVQYLRGKGVRYAQGYVFAPPLPASSYLTLMAAMAPAMGPLDDRADTGNYVGVLRGRAA